MQPIFLVPKVVSLDRFHCTYITGARDVWHLVWIRKAYEKFNLKVVFKSGPTLCSLLTLVEDPLPVEKLAGVVYQIPCQCDKVYVGETQRQLETWVKEHKDACSKGSTEISAIAQDQQHTIDWEGHQSATGQGHKACSASSKGSLLHSENSCQRQAQP